LKISDKEVEKRNEVQIGMKDRVSSLKKEKRIEAEL